MFEGRSMKLLAGFVLAGFLGTTLLTGVADAARGGGGPRGGGGSRGGHSTVHRAPASRSGPAVRVGPRSGGGPVIHRAPAHRGGHVIHRGHGPVVYHHHGHRFHRGYWYGPGYWGPAYWGWSFFLPGFGPVWYRHGHYYDGAGVLLAGAILGAAIAEANNNREVIYVNDGAVIVDEGDPTHVPQRVVVQPSRPTVQSSIEVRPATVTIRPSTIKVVKPVEPEE